MKKTIGCVTIFLAAFTIIALVFFGYSLWSVWRSTQAASWPTVPGTLTNVVLKEQTHEDSKSYRVEVAYKYDVVGRGYTGSRLAFGYAGSGNQEMHEEIYQKLKAAKSVDVYYDPTDPARSTLSHGIHLSIKVSLIISAGLFAVCALLWWFIGHHDPVLLDNLHVR